MLVNGTRKRRCAALAAAVAVTAGGFALTGTSGADVTAVSGSAYGYRTEVSLFGGPTGIRGFGQYICTGTDPGPPPVPTPLGCVPATGPGNFAEASSPSVVLPPDGSLTTASKGFPPGVVGRYGPGVIFTAANVSVSTEGSTGPGGFVTSTADLTGIPTSTVGEIIYAGAIHGECTQLEADPSSGATSTSGFATFSGPGDPLASNQGPPFPNPPNPPPANATLRTSDGNPDVEGDETYYDIPANPDPNTSVHGTLEAVGDEFTVIFNEQIENADGSFTVNAVHEILEGPTAIGNAYIGHVVCGVTTVPGTTTTEGNTTTTQGNTTTTQGNTTTTQGNTTTTSVVSGGTTLTCVPLVRPNGTTFLKCTAHAPIGINTVNVINATTGVREQQLKVKRHPPVPRLKFKINTNAGDPYRVTVVDRAGNLTKFSVQTDGTVTPII